MMNTNEETAPEETINLSRAVAVLGAEPEQPMRRVRLGSVEVTVPAPTPAELQRGIEESRIAAARLVRALSKLPKRLRLKFDKNTPVYYADAKRPHLVVRKLGKSKQTGLFRNGRFVKIP